MAALLALLLTPGCGTRTSATGVWSEPRPAQVPYQNVLVVGVMPNSRMRRSFEQQVTDAIAAGGTRATASVFVSSEMDLGKPLQ